ncbi:MAG: hypothetical protein AAGA93_12470 [Actinomycetota bacterium]
MRPDGDEGRPAERWIEPDSGHHRDDRLVGNRSWLWIPAGVVAVAMGLAAVASVGGPRETLAGDLGRRGDDSIDGDLNRFAPAERGEEATSSSSAPSSTAPLSSAPPASAATSSTSTTTDSTTTSPAEGSTTSSIAALRSSSTTASTTSSSTTVTASTTTTTTTTTQPPTTPAPTTTTTTAVTSTASGCHPSYTGACVPIASDVDCLGGSGNGPEYVQGPVTVVGEDVYGLDHDNDGIGCEP